VERAAVELERWVAGGKLRERFVAIGPRFEGLQDRPVLLWLIFFVLVCTRACLWLANAQFYIEDGTQFYGRAYSEGAATLVSPYASYYHLWPRLFALFAVRLPLRFGPITLELLALAVQALAATFFASRLLEKQIPSAAGRWVCGFAVIAFPYSNELFGNVAHSQWYLALVSLVIICGAAPASLLARIGEYAMLAMNCLTGPFAPVLAGIGWSKWRGDPKRFAVAIVASLAAVPTVAAMIARPRSGMPHRWRMSLFYRVVANQVVFGPLGGFRYAYSREYDPFFNWPEFGAALFAAFTFAWALRQLPPFARALSLLGFFSFLASLDSKVSWILIGAPGVGERYFFFLGLAMILCVWQCSRTMPFATLRWFYRLLLAICAIATIVNWVYAPPFSRFNYAPQIAGFDALKPGETLEIQFPIDRKGSKPHWTLEIKKK